MSGGGRMAERGGKLFGELPAQRILVTGAPRSATTFVGKVLSMPISVDYLHEPLNVLCGVPAVQRAFLDLGGLRGQQRQQVFGEIDALLRYEPVLRTGYYVRDPLLTRVVKPVVGSRGPVFLRLARINPFSASVVVKDPFAALSIETFIDEWGFRPVALVRHPIAFVASLQRLGWEPSLMLADLAAQPSIVERLHDEDRQLIGRPAMAEWESAALLWRIVAREFQRVATERASVVLATHEGVSDQPIEFFRGLFGDLGLPWSDRIERRIERMTTGSDVEAAGNRTQSFTRDSRQLLSLRLDQIDADVRRGVWDLTGEVAAPWYRVDGVLPEAARGVVGPGTPGAAPAPATEALASSPPVGSSARRRSVLGLAVPAGRTGSLADQMVLDACQRWLSHVLDRETDRAFGEPRSAVTILAGGLIGPPAPAGGPTGWTPTVVMDPRRRHLLMGVGWTDPDARWSPVVRRAARLGLSRHYLHAVRDRVARERLVEVGIHNVVVTGCPTTWEVDAARVRRDPGRRALVALRHDLDDEHMVSSLVVLLDECYEDVLLLPLHPRDRRFLPLLPRHWEVLPSRLEVFDAVLAEGDVDVVGTSAHTGVRGLAGGARALILDGDPHLRSIVEPLGLPTFDRRDLADLRAATASPLRLRPGRRPEAIDEWLGQFLWAGEPQLRPLPWVVEQPTT